MTETTPPAVRRCAAATAEQVANGDRLRPLVHGGDVAGLGVLPRLPGPRVRQGAHRLVERPARDALCRPKRKPAHWRQRVLRHRF
jgi:hypothetical protein